MLMLNLRCMNSIENIKCVNYMMHAYMQVQDTALHKAVTKANKEVVELLVQNNADIEKTDQVHA